jgi:hypothetical protein
MNKEKRAKGLPRVEEERENSKQPAEDHFWILHINYIGLKVK